MEFSMLGKSSESTKVDILLYGRSGAGKTFAAATAPTPFLIGPDPTGHKSVPYPIPGIVVNELSQVDEVLNWFEDGGHKSENIETLIVDGLSFFYDLYTKEVGQFFVDNHGAKDVDLMPISARLKISNSYKRMLRRMVNLTQSDHPVHVIFTTLDERLKEDERADFQIRPHFGSGKMNETYPAFFSVIGYVNPTGETDDDGIPTQKRNLLFTEYKGILARDRLNIFPMYVENIKLTEYLN